MRKILSKLVTLFVFSIITFDSFAGSYCCWGCRACCQNCTGGRTPCVTTSQLDRHLEQVFDLIALDQTDSFWSTHENYMTHKWDRIEHEWIEMFNHAITAVTASEQRINEYEMVLENHRNQKKQANNLPATVCMNNNMGFGKTLAKNQKNATKKEIVKVSKKRNSDFTTQKVDQLAKQRLHTLKYCNELEEQQGKCPINGNTVPDGDIITEKLFQPNDDMTYDTDIEAELMAVDYMNNMTPEIGHKVTAQQEKTAAGLEYENFKRTWNQNKNAYESYISEIIAARMPNPELLPLAQEMGFEGDKISPRGYQEFIAQAKINPEHTWWKSFLKLLKTQNLDRELIYMERDAQEQDLRFYEQLERQNLILSHSLAVLNNTLLYDKVNQARSKVSASGR